MYLNLKWISCPFIRYVLLMGSGIILAHQKLYYPLVNTMFVLLCGLFLCLQLIRHKLKIDNSQSISGTLALLILFHVGFIRYNQSDVSRQNDHLVNIKRNYTHYIGQIVDGPDRGSKAVGYHLNVNHIKCNEYGWKKANAAIRLYLKNDSILYVPGDQLLIYGQPDLIKAPTNPAAFNYQAYMANKHIYFRHFVKHSQIILVDSNTINPIVAFAKKITNKVKHIIEASIESERERSIIIPLLTGYKGVISDDLKKIYGEAGALHVLAVSGLHVGIIYFVLLKVFGWIKKMKGGKWFFLIICLFVLWMYALITGLSASVVRAALMFSLIILAKSLRKSSNVYNNISLTACLLLLIKPNFLFDVGFQLSFIAIIGIIYLQPKLVMLWQPKYVVFSKIWDLTSVSIAAQLATFPFSLYYFHQFPTYFWLSNLLVIPAAFLIILSGIVTIAVVSLGFPGSIFSLFLEKTTYFTNEGIQKITWLPYHVIDNIYISYEQLLCLMAGLALLLHFLQIKKLVILAEAFVCIGLLIGIQAHRINKNAIQSKIVFYDIRNTCAVDMIETGENNFYLQSRPGASASDLMYGIAGFRLINGLTTADLNKSAIKQSKLQFEDYQFFRVKDQALLFLNSKLYFKKNHKQKITVNLLIVNNQSILNFDEINKHFKFDKIIISNLNSEKYSAALYDFCINNSLPVYHLKRQGALELNLQ